MQVFGIEVLIRGSFHVPDFKSVVLIQNTFFDLLLLFLSSKTWSMAGRDFAGVAWFRALNSLDTHRQRLRWMGERQGNLRTFLLVERYRWIV